MYVIYYNFLILKERLCFYILFIINKFVFIDCLAYVKVVLK